MGKRKIFGVSAVEMSDNSKIGHTSATYVSQRSCWDGCPLMGNGCYAEHDFTGFTTRRINREAEMNSLDAVNLAINEANGIDTLTGKLPLRLHVVGDCKTRKAASIIAAASGRYMSRFGQKVWSYTHVWRTVTRASWQKVSILASCETIRDARKAMKRGYAAAVVFTDASQIPASTSDLRVIHCPQQTKKTANCTTCKLCWDADRLLKLRIVIGFTTHGGGEEKASVAVSVATAPFVILQ